MSFFLLLVGVFALVFFPSPLAAERKTDVRTIKGIQFNVPEDWPIEERGGALGPIPVEEYVTLKFGKIEERFKTIEADQANSFSTLSEVRTRLKKLEKKIEDIDQRLIDLERWLKHGEARQLG